MRRDAPIAVPKTGQCPPGWTQSGSYCVENAAALTPLRPTLSPDYARGAAAQNARPARFPDRR